MVGFGAAMSNHSTRLAYALFILWGTFTRAWSQEDLLLDVDANCGPWIFKEGGLNGGYPYGRGDHLPPVVVKADGQFPFRRGELIQIQYLSKRARSVAWNYDNSCDSEGETIRLVNDFKGYTGKYMPSRYISSIEYPVFLMSLIGVFTDENGSIIGSPFKVGLNRIVQVPDGAKQIQFGINDDWFQTPPSNLGSYQIILKRLPQPNLVAPQQSDQEVDALLGEGGIGVTTHQMLGDCRIQSITPGGSAEREGRLKKDDVILAVTDNSNNWIDVEEIKLPVIRRLLRGAVGSEVQLRIMRPADPRMGIFDVKLRREKLSGVKLSSNERQKSIRLGWKKDTGSSLWEAEVNRFDVPSGAVVEVKGPKDGLIRVTGDQPTSIYGAITSSNPVYVINPNGVVVGPGATINDNLKTLHINRNSQQIETSVDKETEKRKKEMERVWKMAYDFVEGPGVSRPNWISQGGGLQEIQETGDIYISCGNNALNDYIWLGNIRVGGLSENKDEQGIFRRNEATIFPNNPQSATNPQQNP